MKIVLALLLLAGDPSFTDRWDAVRGKADRETVAPASAPEPEQRVEKQKIEKPRRPREASKERRAVRHQRRTRFKCHRVYVTKYKWHCQRGRG